MSRRCERLGSDNSAATGPDSRPMARLLAWSRAGRCRSKNLGEIAAEFVQGEPHSLRVARFERHDLDAFAAQGLGQRPACRRGDANLVAGPGDPAQRREHRPLAPVERGIFAEDENGGHA